MRVIRVSIRAVSSLPFMGTGLKRYWKWQQLQCGRSEIGQGRDRELVNNHCRLLLKPLSGNHSAILNCSEKSNSWSSSRFKANSNRAADMKYARPCLISPDGLKLIVGKFICFDKRLKVSKITLGKKKKKDPSLLVQMLKKKWSHKTC